MSKYTTLPRRQLRNNFLILVVDDNEDNALFACGSLEILSFRCIVANNGVSAIDIAKDRLPDLILMDIVMPDMDGISVTRHLKSNFLTSHIPIIAVTGLAFPAQKKKILEGGCNDYLCKPYLIEELSEKIDSLLALNMLELHQNSCA